MKQQIIKLSILAGVALRKGNFAETYKITLQMLPLIEKVGGKGCFEAIVTHEHLGDCCIQMKKPAQAIPHYLKLCELREGSKRTTVKELLSAYDSLINAYHKADRHAECLVYNKKELDLHLKQPSDAQDLTRIAHLHNNMAIKLLELNDNRAEEALSYFKKAIQLFLQIKPLNVDVLAKTKLSYENVLEAFKNDLPPEVLLEHQKWLAAFMQQN